MHLASVTRRWLALFAVGLLIATPPLVAAAKGGFTATLSAEQREAAGLTTLSVDERAALDQLVADDLAFARREKMTVLDQPFVARLPETSRKQAGLDRLKPEQLAKLNELVAAAIAARPTPKERPRLKETDVLGNRRPEIHGSVSVAYGWGAGGRDFRAGSLWLNYYDPESRIGIGVGISSMSGPGYYGYSPYYYSDRYYPDRYYPASVGYVDYYDPLPIYVSSGGRGDFGGGFRGDGACFRGVGGGGRRH
jgi:hypothetical protein